MKLRVAPTSAVAMRNPLGTRGALERWTSTARNSGFGQEEEQIDLRSRAGPVEEGVRPSWRGSDEILDHEPFPAGARHGVAEKLFQ